METLRLQEAVEMLPAVLTFGAVALAVGLAALVYRARTR